MSHTQVVLVDAKNLCYRAHWTHRMLSSHGRPTSILFGVPNMLLSMARKLPYTPFVFVWDGAGGATWRHSLAPGVYKSNRPPLQGSSDVVTCQRQIPQLVEFFERIGVRQFRIPRVEADDLIGVLATTIIEKHLFDEVIIQSSDKDYFQLISPRVHVLRDTKEGVHFVKDADVVQEYGTGVQNWVKLRALTGDKSDCIPGIKKGLGPKTAAKLLAMGLDPSLPEFKLHHESVRAALAEFAPLWPAVRTNYVLSHIVPDPDWQYVPASIRVKLRQMTASLTRKRLLCKADCRNDATFDWLAKYITDYEMSELFIRRRELWALP